MLVKEMFRVYERGKLIVWVLCVGVLSEDLTKRVVSGYRNRTPPKSIKLKLLSTLEVDNGL